MAENKDKYVIHFLGRNCIWGTTGVYSRTFFVQHFSVWPFFHNEGNWLFKFADDSTHYRMVDTLDEVIKLLECDSTMLFKRYSDNQMKANITKCHLLVNKDDEIIINLVEMEIKNSEYEKFLGIKVDTELKFNEHLNSIISKASCIVNALSRLCPIRVYLRRRYWWTHFLTQFNYCLLIWIFHSHIMNNKIYLLHKRCMHLIYGDDTSSLEELLEQGKSVSVH